MKRLTKASKIGLAALLIAITFFALTVFFALYQPEVDSAVNTLENAILKDNSPVENELVAEAATSYSDRSVTFSLSDVVNSTEFELLNTSEGSYYRSASLSGNAEYKFTLKLNAKDNWLSESDLTTFLSKGYIRCAFAVYVINDADDSQEFGIGIGNTNYTDFSASSAKNKMYWFWSDFGTAIKGNSVTVNGKVSVNASIANAAEVGGLRIKLRFNDGSAPSVEDPDHKTIDNSNYTKSSSLTITDSISGIKQINYTFTALGKNTGENKTIAFTTYTANYVFTFLEYGEYTITSVTDNVGNVVNANKSYRYFKPEPLTINSVSSGGTGGNITVFLNDEETTARYFSDGFYNDNFVIKVSVNSSYYFAGLKIVRTGGVDETIFNTDGSYSYDIPYSTDQITTITAYFVGFTLSVRSESEYSSGNSVTASVNETPNLGDAAAAPYTVKNNSISLSLSYSGTTAGGETWSNDSGALYAGTYTVTASAKYNNNITVGTETSTFTITKKTVYAAPEFASSSKVYDGKASFDIEAWNLYTSDSRSDADIISDSADGIAVNADTVYSVGNANAGTYTFAFNADNLALTAPDTTYKESILASYILDAGEISVFSVSGLDAADQTVLSITKKPLTLNFYLAEKTADGFQKYTGKVYDNTTAVLSDTYKLFVYQSEDSVLNDFKALAPAPGEIGLGISVVGMIGEETYAVRLEDIITSENATLTITLPEKPTYPNASVGEDYLASITRTEITLSSDNYRIANNSSTSIAGLKITKRPLTVTIRAEDKPYDGSTSVNYSYTLTNVAEGDVVSLTGGSASFKSVDAGSHTVTFKDYELSGDKAGNYSLVNTEAETSATIYPKPVTWSATYSGTATDPDSLKDVRGKIFDGTTDTGDLISIEVLGTVGDDDAVTGFSASFDSKYAGETSITVTLDGTDPNYDFQQKTEYTIISLKIVPKSIAAPAEGEADGFEFTLNTTSFVYSAEAHAPTLTATEDLDINSEIYSFGQDDYAVTIPSDSVTVGTYTVTIKGQGNYCGTRTLTYSITKGSFTATLGTENKVITLKYGVTLNLDAVAEYFPKIGAADKKSSIPIENGTWEFVIPSDIYNEKGNTGLYSATAADKPHTVNVLYTLPDEVAENYEQTSVSISVNLYVTPGKLNITIFPKTFTFGSVYSLGAVKDTDFAVTGFEAGDEGNLSGVSFALTDAGAFDASEDTLNDAGVYAGAITLLGYKCDNYTVEFTSGAVTIDPLPVTVNPKTEQSKFYGEPDPELLYDLSSVYELRAKYKLDPKQLKGALSRTPGETAMAYAYSAGTLASDNYSLTFKPDSNNFFTVKPLPVTVIPSDCEVYYGQTVYTPYVYTVNIDTEKYKVDYKFSFSDGKLSFTLDDKVLSETLTVSLTTKATDSSNVGEYEILVSDAFSEDASKDVNLVLSSGNAAKYTVKKLPLNITPNTLQKTYGSNDPVHSSFSPYYSWSTNADIQLRVNFTPNLSGNIVRESGEDVGVYKWLQGTLVSDDEANINTNYQISFTNPAGNAFTIAARPIKITANRFSITVGEETPEGLGTFTMDPSSTLYDTSWTYTGYKPASVYEVIEGQLTIENPSYDDNRLLHVRRDNNGNVIGYDLVPDETLKDYYVPGNLPADYSHNYYVSVIFSATGAMYVEQLIAYISLSEALTFDFGTTANAINVAIADKFIAVNNLDGNEISHSEIKGSISLSLDKTVDYPVAGEYGIDISALKSTNYDIRAALTGTGFVSVKPLKVTVTVIDTEENLSRIYGEPEYPIETHEFVGAVAGFDIEGSLSRVSGNTAGEYTVTLGTLNNPNYELSFDKTYVYTILPRPIVVKPKETGNVYGAAAKSIEYETYFDGDPGKAGLVSGDTLSGALSRNNLSVTDAGTYEIVIGTLNLESSPNRNANYTVRLDDSKKYYYTISKAAVSVFASSVSREFGYAARGSISLTYTTSGLIGSDKLSGSLSLENPVYDSYGYLMPGVYNILKGDIYNDNYNLSFYSNTYTVTRRNLTYYVQYNVLSYGILDYAAGTTIELGENGFEALLGGGLVEGYGFSPEIKLDLGSQPDGVLNAGTYKYVYSYEGADYVFGQTITTDVYRITVGNLSSELVITPARLRLAVLINGTLYTLGNTADAAGEVELTYNGSPAVVEAVLTDETGMSVVTTDFSLSLVYQLLISGRFSVADKIDDVGTYRLMGKIDRLSDVNYQIVGKGSGSVAELLLRVGVSPAVIEADSVKALENNSEKVYGSPDPDLETVYTGFNGEEITVRFERTPGEDAGSYDIVYAYADNADYANNYSIELISFATFTIVPYEIELNASEILSGRLGKTYGEADPSFEAAVTGVNGEQITVSFQRTPGEDVNDYLIESVAAEDETAIKNYKLSLDGKTYFTVSKKNASVSAVGKETVFCGSVYTVESLALSYTLEGFIDDDENDVSGSLTVQNEILHAGIYEIVCAEEFTHPNYDISYIPAFVTVNRAAVTIESYDRGDASYDFNAELGCVSGDNFSYRVIAGTVYPGYELSGRPGDVAMRAGKHPIPQGSLTNESNPDYDITYVAGEITINYVELIVIPESAEQIYGEAFSEIEFTVVRSDGEAFGLEVYGKLGFTGDSEPNAHAGVYNITLGSLIQENPNYNFELAAEGAKYVIVPRPVSVIPTNVTEVYGNAEQTLKFTLGGDYGLAAGDILNIALVKESGTGVGTYVISVADGYADANPDYEISTDTGTYEITPRKVTVSLRNQAQDFNAEGVYTVDQTAYDITEGKVMAGDDLGLIIEKELGSSMGLYELSAYSENKNYEVACIGALFEIRKFTAVIEVASTVLELVYSGESYSVAATATSGAEITCSYTFNGENFTGNSFTDIGRYVLTLSAPETDFYYAPVPLTVYLTINKNVLVADNSGINVIVNSDSGFAPEMELNIEKMPQDDKELNSVLASNETVVRAFSIEVVTSEGGGMLGSEPSVYVKVPDALKDQQQVKVVVKDNGVYSVRILEIDENGYVTISETTEITSFAFVKEESTENWLIILLAGAALLIVVVSATVFMLKKRG